MPWLKDVFLFALLTGERLDGLFLAKWENIEGSFLKIPNWKVNRAKGYSDFRYIPITQDLSELLGKLNPGTGFIFCGEIKNRELLKSYCSKGFIHFWRLTGIDKQISFRHLRKTYLTRIWILLGDKSKGLKSHKHLSTQIDYYLNQADILKELTGLKLFKTL